MENIDFAKVIEACPIKLYCNGFIIGVGSADVTVVLNLNGKNIGALNLSYTSAKTLSESLGKGILDFERKTGQKIMTAPFIEGKITSNRPKTKATPDASH
jgi:hypothetical protein